METQELVAELVLTTYGHALARRRKHLTFLIQDIYLILALIGAAYRQPNAYDRGNGGDGERHERNELQRRERRRYAA